MKVVIVGSGNVATVLGKRIANAGHEILQVVSRSLINAESLANQLNSSAADDMQAINTNGDLYLICVADHAIEGVASAFPFQDKLVVHTAGAVSIKVLHKHKTYGVLYPLQSLRKKSADVTELPMLVDGNSTTVTQQLLNFASGWAAPVSAAHDEQRLKLHVAAVFASNFTNHIYTLTEEFCKKENVDFNNLIPLIKETAQRLNTASPSTLQTGPAQRNDTATMEKHLDILKAYTDLKNLYSIFSASIARQSS